MIKYLIIISQIRKKILEISFFLLINIVLIFLIYFIIFDFINLIII